MSWKGTGTWSESLTFNETTTTTIIINNCKYLTSEATLVWKRGRGLYVIMWSFWGEVSDTEYGTELGRAESCWKKSWCFLLSFNYIFVLCLFYLIYIIYLIPDQICQHGAKPVRLRRVSTFSLACSCHQLWDFFYDKCALWKFVHLVVTVGTHVAPLGYSDFGHCAYSKNFKLILPLVLTVICTPSGDSYNYTNSFCLLWWWWELHELI